MYYIIFNTVKLFTATFFLRNKLLLITYLLLLTATVSAVVFQTWNWNKAGDAKDWSDLGHVCNFRQYLYFSVLVSSASFLLLGFVSCTLWPLHLNLIFGNCGDFSNKRLFKIVRYLCVYFVQKTSRNDCRNTFLTREYLVVERFPNPRWISLVMLYRFE